MASVSRTSTKPENVKKRKVNIKFDEKSKSYFFRYLTQSDLTPNFPTFSKPILNLDFYIKTDQGST